MIGFNTKTASQETSQENIGITVLQSRVIELIRSNPRITAKIIAKEIGIAPRNVQTHISALKNQA